MKPRVDEIILPEPVSKDYLAAGPHNSLPGVKRLNAFVGPNNSGKSRLLRELFIASTKLVVASSEDNSYKAREAVRLCLDLLPGVAKQSVTKDLKDNLIAVPLGFHQLNQHFPQLPKQLQALIDVAHRLEQAWQEYRSYGNPPVNLDLVRNMSQSLRSIASAVEKLGSQGLPKNGGTAAERPVEKPRLKNAKFVYIPTLRGMRLGSGVDRNQFAYFDRTWDDYFSGRILPSNQESTDAARLGYHGTSVLTGLDLYEWLENKLLGDLRGRDLVRDYQNYLSETFFQGETVTLIPRRKHHSVHYKVGKERERPVDRLGDGLQQIIILTLPIFEHRDVPLFLFIEEPDLFLHPGFQRVFIETVLADQDRELYVFATTHSSQFLDITVSSDHCSIFRCEKLKSEETGEEVDPKFRVENATFGDVSLLNHIGVKPSSVMFANCTIWVEGITDRLYFSRFVDLMLKATDLNYTEGLHYSFVEYGGGNITHWSFLDDEEGIDVERLCSRLLLISDRDSNKEARHEKLAETLKERFVLLPVRESENLLTPDTIVNVIHSYEGDDIELHGFSQGDYCEEYLGTFIDSKVLPDKTKSKRYRKLGTCYADTSGTVKAKVEFCRRAIPNINSLADLSESAKSVTQKICDFIVEENRQ